MLSNLRLWCSDPFSYLQRHLWWFYYKCCFSEHVPWRLWWVHYPVVHHVPQQQSHEPGGHSGFQPSPGVQPNRDTYCPGLQPGSSVQSGRDTYHPRVQSGRDTYRPCVQSGCDPSVQSGPQSGHDPGRTPHYRLPCRVYSFCRPEEVLWWCLRVLWLLQYRPFHQWWLMLDSPVHCQFLLPCWYSSEPSKEVWPAFGSCC